MSFIESDIIHHWLEYNISLVRLIYGGMIVGVFVVGVLINLAEKRLPHQLVTTYKYGKLNERNAKQTLKTVPKSWFRHFYIVGSIWSGVVMWLFFTIYMCDGKPPAWFVVLLDIFASRKRNTSGPAAAAFLGMLLLFIHCCIRLLEVFFISVYSPSRINITHYGCGIFHYIAAAIAIAAESPLIPGSFSWSELTCVAYVSLVIFCVASYQQLKSSCILANLRKNKKGSVFTYRHMVPRGGLFEIISSPHITAEIIIYIALTTILWNNTTWWFVFIWVLVNQIEAALLNHWWYQKKFHNYPRDRKALIPFIL